MRAVIGRLRRLENRVGPQRYMERQRLADLLRDRRRRRLEASGEPFEDLPLEGVAPGPVRYLSVPETLRLSLVLRTVVDRVGSCQSGSRRIARVCFCVFAGSLRLEACPRNRCTTTASPCFFIRRSNFRTHRSVTPIRSAASRCVIFLSRARSTSPACPVPLGSLRFVPSFSLATVNRNFLLGSIRNFSPGRDTLQFRPLTRVLQADNSC